MNGQAIITISGLEALQQAISQRRQIKLKSFKVSDQDLSLSPTLTSIPGVWYSADISGYFPINANTVEFLLQIPENLMTKWGRTYGLYLEDGTLFAVAKPPYPFPPGAKSIFKVQISFQNLTEHVSFEYIPFSETEQDLSLLHTTATLSQILLETKEEVEKIRYSLLPLKKALLSEIDTLNRLINQIRQLLEQADLEQRLSLLDTTATLADIITELKEEIERLKVRKHAN